MVAPARRTCPASISALMRLRETAAASRQASGRAVHPPPPHPPAARPVRRRFRRHGRETEPEPRHPQGRRHRDGRADRPRLRRGGVRDDAAAGRISARRRGRPPAWRGPLRGAAGLRGGGDRRPRRTARAAPGARGLVPGPDLSRRRAGARSAGWSWRPRREQPWERMSR